MSLNLDQLEINVNLHALQPGFLNSELHYIIAESENSFRFVNWNEEPGSNEEKFYCYLTEEELLIPAGNIQLKESYVLKQEAIYPIVTNHIDFANAIECIKSDGVCKRIRRFSAEDIDVIKGELEEKYGPIEKHVVTSRQGQHLLLLVEHVEISISANMVYFRHKTPFNESHYEHVKEEQREN
ncbi:MAG: hypothetical protein JWQ40_1945 [Segetibacter sp.]|nr:hypothetical protein [Segetibacter sp.]